MPSSSIITTRLACPDPQTRGLPGARAARTDPGWRDARPDASGRPDRLLCLDIETTPDRELLPADWPQDKFPKPAWHAVAAISYLVARIDTDPENGRERYTVEACRSGGEPGWTEAQLLRGFWHFFAEGRYRVVTFNGRSFDIPTLHLRSLLHGIPAAAWFNRGDKWNGYAKRYAADWHSDLLDLTSNFGASTRMGLDELATAMGLPGKSGCDGSQVAAMIEQGRIGHVRDYCELDTLNTFGLYVRWALLSGRSDAAGHDASMRALAEFLERQRHERHHLGAFLDRWRSSARPRPALVGVGRSTDNDMEAAPGTRPADTPRPTPTTSPGEDPASHR